MKETKKFLILITLAVALVLIASPTQASAQALPAKVKSLLNENYSGWKLARADKNCGAPFLKSIVSGDFDGNGKADYAVKFSSGKRGFIVAFLSQGASYKQMVLESDTVSSMKQQGLDIARKGERYDEIINENFDRAKRKLATDAPIGGTCRASSYLYVYQGGKFKRAFTSD